MSSMNISLSHEADCLVPPFGRPPAERLLPPSRSRSVDWTEKYRPKTLKDVVGNPTAIAEFRKWGESWAKKPPEKRALVLSGSPGIGKTSAAAALAHDLGWGLVEMNASDKRNADAVRRLALQGAITQTFSATVEILPTSEGKHTRIVLDEADNLLGREDLRGIGAIGDTIRQTHQPIVLICNDYYELSRRSGAIRSLTKQIKWQRLSPAAVKAVLKRIAAAEKVNASEEALEAIAAHAGGDLRSAVNDLQALAEGAIEVRPADVKTLGDRDVEGSVFDALREIFQSGDGKRARRAVENLDEDPESLILWIDENLPFEYRDPEDLARGYGVLSRADVYLGRARRSQVYRFWSYASDLMTAGVATARKGRSGGGPYRFPLWLSKMSRSRGRRGTAESLSRKIGAGVHTSWRRAFHDLLPSFKQVFQTDEEFRRAMAAQFRFGEKELAYLLDADEDAKEVRALAAGTAPEAARPTKGGLAEFEGERSALLRVPLARVHALRELAGPVE